MAIVYQAFDTHLEADVAVKIIRSEWLLIKGQEILSTANCAQENSNPPADEKKAATQFPIKGR